MNFLAPGFFLAALGVAAGTIALHFLVIRQPPSAALPTARFVPAARVHIVTVARRPEDLLLLLLRVLIVLLVGAAFARPVLVPRSGSVARVVLADRSDAVAQPRDVTDSLAGVVRPGDVVIGFDTAAHAWLSDADGATAVPMPARLSPALIAAIRAGTRLRTAADSIEIVIVSAFAADGWDGATAEIRRLWRGRIRLVEVASRPGTSHEPAFVVESAEDDPVRLAAAAAAIGPGDSSVRVVRTVPATRDSAWAAEGGTLIRWPATGAPVGWTVKEPADSVGAVVARGVAVVFPFERRWQADSAGGGTAVARWVDGSPAAIERRVGRGCLRDVAVPVTPLGDFILRPDFARLLEALTMPCGMAGPGSSARPEKALLAGTGPLAHRGSVPAQESGETPLVPWLLAAALLLAMAELGLRQGSRTEEPAA